jgi:hypothetical protein
MQILSFLSVLAMFVQGQAYLAPKTIDMGSAAHYAVVGAQTVTNAGATRIHGDLALHPGTSVTGFPPGQVDGEMSIADSNALKAKNDLEAASIDAESRAYNQLLNGDAGGMTLSTGVYRSTSALDITGVLKLDCQGAQLRNAVWIFQIVSKLTVAVGATVEYVNCNEFSNPQAFWNVGSSATINDNSTIVGTVMAYDMIAAKAGATTGALMARTDAVTLIRNYISVPDEQAAEDSSNGVTTSSAGSTNTAQTQGFQAGIAIACIVIFLVFVGAIYYITINRISAEEEASAKHNPIGSGEQNKTKFSVVDADEAV